VGFSPAPTCPPAWAKGTRREICEHDLEEAGKRQASWGLVLGLAAALACIALVTYLLWARRSNSKAKAEATAERLHRMLGEKAGRSSLNSSSPMSLDDIKPQLRAGMPFRDLVRLVSEKNTGPLTSTVIGTVPLPEELDDGKPRLLGHIVYLKDANLVVETDESENILSWKSELIK
jgi:hypothetical protein